MLGGGVVNLGEVSGGDGMRNTGGDVTGETTGGDSMQNTGGDVIGETTDDDGT